SWEKTNNLIRFARFVNPYSPSLIDIQYQIVYSKLTLFPQQEDSLIQQLESLNRESIKQRPLWPYTWANLAHIKAYKNEYDELFNEGIQKALHLGPKLSNIQLSILELSIKSWSHLNSATQDIIISQLGTQSYEGKLNQKIVAIIKAQGFLPILCAGIRSPLKAQDLCT
ncbi:MAG: hypothetical protein OEX00_08715, partial [Gammaproteobacteria bacterium]|nr:hypothetical protein [Gammaproteobacteria bacterium]